MDAVILWLVLGGFFCNLYINSLYPKITWWTRIKWIPIYFIWVVIIPCAMMLYFVRNLDD